MRYFQGIVLIFGFIFFGLASAADYVIESPKTCAIINGTWTNGTEPPNLGTCMLHEGAEIINGNRIFIPAGVTVLVSNGTLNNRGVILLSRLARIEINGGQLVNRNAIDMEDDSELLLLSGVNFNYGVIVSEGEINNYVNFNNLGTIRNTGGGQFFSASSAVTYTYSNGNNCEFINDRGTRLTVAGRFIVYQRCSFDNSDEIVVEATGLLDIVGYLNLLSGSDVTIYGRLAALNGGDINNEGEVGIAASGKLFINNNSDLSNQGSGDIVVQRRGILQIDKQSRLTNMGNAALSNEGKILNYDSDIHNSATLTNNGMIENDKTNNSYVSNINNSVSGTIINNTGARIENLFGYLNNNDTLMNDGYIGFCFGRLTGFGTITGNGTIENHCFPRPNFPTIPRFPIIP